MKKPAVIIAAAAGLAVLIAVSSERSGYSQCRAEVEPALSRLADQDRAIDEIENRLIEYAVYGAVEKAD